jgi:hypothetical protein
MGSSSKGCVNVTTLYPKKGTALKDFPRPWFLISLLVACLMCFNGGFINGICFAGPWHSGLTHVTGSVTLSGMFGKNNEILLNSCLVEYSFFFFVFLRFRFLYSFFL